MHPEEANKMALPSITDTLDNITKDLYILVGLGAASRHVIDGIHVRLKRAVMLKARAKEPQATGSAGGDAVLDHGPYSRKPSGSETKVMDDASTSSTDSANSEPKTVKADKHAGTSYLKPQIGKGDEARTIVAGSTDSSVDSPHGDDSPACETDMQVSRFLSMCPDCREAVLGNLKAMKGKCGEHNSSPPSCACEGGSSDAQHECAGRDTQPSPELGEQAKGASAADWTDGAAYKGWTVATTWEAAPTWSQPLYNDDDDDYGDDADDDADGDAGSVPAAPAGANLEIASAGLEAAASAQAAEPEIPRHGSGSGSGGGGGSAKKKGTKGRKPAAVEARRGGSHGREATPPPRRVASGSGGGAGAAVVAGQSKGRAIIFADSESELEGRK